MSSRAPIKNLLLIGLLLGISPSPAGADSPFFCADSLKPSWWPWKKAVAPDTFQESVFLEARERYAAHPQTLFPDERIEEKAAYLSALLERHDPSRGLTLAEVLESGKPRERKRLLERIDRYFTPSGMSPISIGTLITELELFRRRSGIGILDWLPHRKDARIDKLREGLLSEVGKKVLERGLKRDLEAFGRLRENTWKQRVRGILRNPWTRFSISAAANLHVITSGAGYAIVDLPPLNFLRLSDDEIETLLLEPWTEARIQDILRRHQGNWSTQQAYQAILQTTFRVSGVIIAGLITEEVWRSRQNNERIKAENGEKITERVENQINGEMVKEFAEAKRSADTPIADELFERFVIDYQAAHPGEPVDTAAAMFREKRNYYRQIAKDLE